MANLVSRQRGEDGSRPLGQETPGRRGMVHRKDLLELLDRAITKRLTVVSAAPGSGKTSLLRAWTDEKSELRRVAFVSVGRDQRNGQRFWCAVLDAIRRPVDAAAAEARPADADVDRVIDAVLSEIAESAEPVVLIVDDLHELRSSDAAGQLEYFLSNLPSVGRVVLSSRRDPPIRLHQLRLADESSCPPTRTNQVPQDGHELST